MDGMVTKYRRDYNRNIEMAWRTANFMRAKALPSLKRFLIDEGTGHKTHNPDQVTPNEGLQAWFFTVQSMNKR